MSSRSLDAMLSYVAAHVRDHERGRYPSPDASRSEAPRFVTISRQSGAGGPPVAQELARILTEAGAGSSRTPWTVFDRELIRNMVEEQHLPEAFMRDLEERGVTSLESLAEDLFGVRPSVHDHLSKASRTILHLAHLGNAIIIGRGGSVVARNVRGGLHVRLVGSFWRRLQHLREYHDLGPRDVEKLMEKEDQSRRLYLKRYFRKDIDDPLLYDVVINTDDLGHRRTAAAIAELLRIKTGE
jgi:cytidylate kinase